MSWPVPSVSGGQPILTAWGNQVAAALNTLTYEAGTWTPTLQFGGATTGITYSTRVGHYRRVGGLVAVFMRITLSNKGSATGIADIIGLPFSVVSVIQSFNVGYYANTATINGMFLCSVGGTSIILRQRAATVAANLTDANFTNTTDLTMSGVYMIS